ncbi:hypothetical protein [Streptomyces sp. NPDC000878]
MQQIGRGPRFPEADAGKCLVGPDDRALHLLSRRGKCCRRAREPILRNRRITDVQLADAFEATEVRGRERGRRGVVGVVGLDVDLNDEKYTSYDKFSASAGGDTVHLHVECPPKAGLSARG